jgi:hypothetical protein
MSCSDEFIAARIETLKTQIIAYEDAMTALSSGAIMSYTLDTGQSRQVVTRYEIGSLRKTIDSLYNRLVTLEARLTGCGTIISRPGF